MYLSARVPLAGGTSRVSEVVVVFHSMVSVLCDTVVTVIVGIFIYAAELKHVAPGTAESALNTSAPDDEIVLNFQVCTSVPLISAPCNIEVRAFSGDIFDQIA